MIKYLELTDAFFSCFFPIFCEEMFQKCVRKVSVRIFLYSWSNRTRLQGKKYQTIRRRKIFHRCKYKYTRTCHARFSLSKITNANIFCVSIDLLNDPKNDEYTILCKFWIVLFWTCLNGFRSILFPQNTDSSAWFFISFHTCEQKSIFVEN